MTTLAIDRGVVTVYRDGKPVGECEATYLHYLAAGIPPEPCSCGDSECRHGIAHYWGECPSTAELTVMAERQVAHAD